MIAIRTRTAHLPEVDLVVHECGDEGAPLVVLAHGFPETAHSWRHQMIPLARAGYHVIAPDQRGYGHSGAPSNVEAYGIRHLAGDLLSLAEQAGHERAIYVGHDWGALIVWDLCRLHPERVQAACAASVPLVDWPMPPTDLMRARYRDRFFYMLYFQAPGVPEAEFSSDVPAHMAKVLWGASHGANRPLFFDIDDLPPMEGTGFFTHADDAPPLPWSWLTADEFQTYVELFEASGFFGPISYYRNLDANHALIRDYPISRITMPTFFITGDSDPVRRGDPNGIDNMVRLLPNFCGSRVIPGAGHWVQQEQPAAFTDALLGFLDSL